MENKSSKTQPTATAKEYITDDISKQIEEMPNPEMVDLLKNLPMSRVWIAILKYNQLRLNFAQTILFTADPVKNPTDMARQQGVMLGISDLQNAVIELNAPKEEESESGEQG